ncbi:MAG: tol-pal system protein YbgF [Syntrophaceae bacterium]|nr:tol-pal system protein YbgF [Syntrophaceae bacterium]
MNRLRDIVFAVSIAILVSGCATTGDLNKLAGQVQDHRSQIDKQVKAQQENIDRLNESTSALHKSQADVGIEMMSLKEYLQEMQGLNDKQRKDITTRFTKKDEEIKELKEKQDRLILRISFLETYLGLGDKDSKADNGDKEKAGNGTATDTPKVLSEKDQAYAAAYDLFREGSYGKARAQFQDFLKNFPNTEYSDNAQFWIGECYYFEGNYEQAILEYDKVTKNYPKGDKVAPALLKQGLAFISMGDQVSGRLVLQQVIKNYPNTSQARVARSKLLELK